MISCKQKFKKVSKRLKPTGGISDWGASIRHSTVRTMAALDSNKEKASTHLYTYRLLDILGGTVRIPHPVRLSGHDKVSAFPPFIGQQAPVPLIQKSERLANFTDLRTVLPKDIRTRIPQKGAVTPIAGTMYQGKLLTEL